MKITIDSKVLQEDGFTLKDFSVILFYFGGGTGVLNKELCEEMRDRGFLKKTPDGYQFHPGKSSKIKTWIIKSNADSNFLDRLNTLAKAMQREFPEGRKEGTTQYWRDNTTTIAKRLSNFIEKYGNYSDEDFIQATKNYIASFNGNYSYMQLLKYFIYKKDLKTGEENSQLASYLDNINQQNNIDQDWTINLV